MGFLNFFSGTSLKQRRLEISLTEYRTKLEGMESLARAIGDPAISKMPEAEDLRNKTAETEIELRLSGTS